MHRILAATILTLMFGALTLQADWYAGLECGPRFNNGTIRVDNNVMEDNLSVTGLGIGLFSLVDAGEYFRMNFGIAYDTRGFASEASVFGFSSRQEILANYLDVNIGAHWYFLGTEKERLIQPHVFLAAVPGFFLDGKRKTTSGGNSNEEEMSSDATESFHFAIRAGGGVDFQLSDNILLGVKAAYEPGLTNVAKPTNENDSSELKFTTVIVAATLIFRF